MAACTGTRGVKVMDLPNEIMVMVFRKIKGARDRVLFSSACKRLRGIATEFHVFDDLVHNVSDEASAQIAIQHQATHVRVGNSNSSYAAFFSAAKASSSSVTSLVMSDLNPEFFDCLRDFPQVGNLQSLVLVSDRYEAEALPITIPEDVIDTLTSLERFVCPDPAVLPTPSVCRWVTLRELSVIHWKIEDIPDAIGNLVHLETLHMNSATLFDIPASLCSLTNLKDVALGFADDTVVELSTQFNALVNLEKLALIGNSANAPVEFVPAVGLVFPRIKQFILWNGTSISPVIGGWTTLERIVIRGGAVDFLPLEVLGLPKLCRLTLRDVPLALAEDTMDVPDGALTSLEVLHISGTPITEVPGFITRLPNLKVLNLYDNHIAWLPESLAAMPKLEELYISGNLFTHVPTSIVASRIFIDVDTEQAPSVMCNRLTDEFLSRLIH